MTWRTTEPRTVVRAVAEDSREIEGIAVPYGQVATDVEGGPEAFAPAARFDHDRDASFKLQGAHANVSCAGCHKPAPGPGGATDEIPKRVAADSCQREHGRQSVYIEVSARREESRSNQKGIAGQKYPKEEAGLRKDYQREAEEPGPLHEFRKIREPVEQLSDWLHQSASMR